MTTISRREFLNRSTKLGSAAFAAATILPNARSVAGTPANDKIVMAIMDCRSRGSGLARTFASRDDCEMAYVADVDTKMYEQHAKAIADCQGGKMPAFVQDYRKALDDKALDAIEEEV